MPARDKQVAVSDRYLLITHVNGKAASGSAIGGNDQIRFTGGFKLPRDYKTPFMLVVRIVRGKSILAETVVSPEQMQCDEPGTFTYTGEIVGKRLALGDALLVAKFGDNTYGRADLNVK